MRELISEQGNMPDRIPYVVHGSFRKHLGEISSAITTLNATEQAVAIAPVHDCTVVGEENGFVLFEGEQGMEPRQVELPFVQKMLSLKALGGFSLWVNPGGYIGKSTAYEYGIAQERGVPTFFTEKPDDVPFDVEPASVKSPEQIAELIQQSRDTFLEPTESDDPITEAWKQLPFPVASIAVGGIVQYRKRLLLIEDGRWKDNQLTIPGTTVRARETRTSALRRAVDKKFGIDVSAIAPLKTSFMIDGSGFSKPVSNLVFDDRLIEASNERVHAQDGLNHHWVSLEETKALLDAGQVEPNATMLLRDHLKMAA